MGRRIQTAALTFALLALVIAFYMKRRSVEWRMVTSSVSEGPSHRKNSISESTASTAYSTGLSLRRGRMGRVVSFFKIVVGARYFYGIIRPAINGDHEIVGRSVKSNPRGSRIIGLIVAENTIVIHQPAGTENVGTIWLQPVLRGAEIPVTGICIWGMSVFQIPEVVQGAG